MSKANFIDRISTLLKVIEPIPEMVELSNTIPYSIEGSRDPRSEWNIQLYRNGDARKAHNLIENNARIAKNYMYDTLRGNGPQLMDATLDSYRVEPKCQSQAKALDVAKRYSKNYETVSENGKGLILFGSVGTGKDHLMMGIAKKLYYHHKSVMWTNGTRLKARMRGCIGREGESESDVIRDYVAPDFLWISDPIIAGNPMTTFQTEFFHGIVDARYMEKKPILLTINVKDGDELEAALGAASVDRMKSNGFAHYCNWKTERRLASIDDLPL